MLNWNHEGLLCFFGDSVVAITYLFLCKNPLYSEDLKDKYSKAESNLTELKRLGATLLHGVDTKKMKLHPDLKNRKFDRIIFNLPHAGFKGKEDDLHMIKYVVVDALDLDNCSCSSNVLVGTLFLFFKWIGCIILFLSNEFFKYIVD